MLREHNKINEGVRPDLQNMPRSSFRTRRDRSLTGFRAATKVSSLLQSEQPLMRLSPNSRTTIRNTATEVFGKGVAVRLFGSRINDTLKGGDLDLFVELPAPDPEQRRRSLTFVALLQQRLGDQPIDVVVADPQTPETAIVREARAHGTLL